MPEEIKSRLIEEEMKQSYMDYAMSVIVSRALPDVRDGLKPVHRRILYAMNKLGLLHNKPFRKSAHVVGQVLAAYHPHGDIAVYDSLVRMAQDFSLRYPLIKGQGNWGSIDGHPAAAMRYCVSGDSRIITERGLERIEEISDNENIKLRILSKDKKINCASKWFDSSKHETIKIVTNKGYSLTGSRNHPILTLTRSMVGRPVFKWKLLEQIEEGDIAVIDRKEDDFWPEDEINLRKYHPEIKNGHQHIRKLPERLDENLAFLLGALVAEGSISKNKLEFCNTDLQFIEEFINKWKSIFPDSNLHKFKRKPSSYGKKDYFRLECHCRYTLEFLRNIGLEAVLSKDKVIPDLILKSPKKVVVSFLRSYFEGDGSISYSRKMIELSCCSKSNKLLKIFQILLLRFGIDTFRRFDRHKNIHKLYLRGKRNVLRFYKDINFISRKKRQKLEFVILNYEKEKSLTDFVPFISDFIRNLSKSEFINKNNFDRYANMNKNYKRIASILLQEIKIDYSSIFEYFLTYNYLFDKIIKKENAGIQEVYSIRVDSDCHSFISNGFISHNTECKLSKIAEELLLDIEKETVNFVPNYDNSTVEPTVLPSKIPNLLINGSSGIAVGMATNIPPHNISEVIDALTLMIGNPNVSIEELMQIIKGPDFPTGGLICGRKGIIDAYKTGRGRVVVKAKTKIEEGKIVIEEIPYMINKSLLLEGIANLVKEKRVEGVRDIRDESDREGLRIVIELKKDANAEYVLNNLMKQTQLMETFGVIMLALVNNEPKVLNLKELLEFYLLHRKEVVTRRSKFELLKAEDRAHILVGLKKALQYIDPVVKTIKASENTEIALKKLMEVFRLSEKQSRAILEMKLQRLTSLETKKIQEEYDSLIKLIEKLKDILSSEVKIMEVIKNELLEMKKLYGDERKTKFLDEEGEIEHEDLIKEEDVVVMITNAGYIKQTPLSLYKQQKRGGVGVIGAGTKDEDIIENLFITSNMNYLLFFTNKGKLHWLKSYQIPITTRYAKGKAIVNLLKLEENEKVNAILPIKQFDDMHYLLFATKKGILKKTALNEYNNPRKKGIKAINLINDEVEMVRLTPGNLDFILCTKKGQAVKFNEKDVRPMGRNATGVRGIRLDKDDEVIGMEVAFDKAALLTVTENGYGKRTMMDEYRLIRRGGKGVTNIKISSKNGDVVGVKTVLDHDELMLISEKGVVIRVAAKDISCIGRVTQGVRVMKLKDKDKLKRVARVIKND